ncbi:MAG TPA: DUF551 domain-containing protein [Pyrinomonadaceae bacterium]|nr:DUF551 domain-containing protein [Pyrinomonadaceae bacterium]
MSWIKVADVTPPDGEPVLIYDERNRKMELGRYLDGQWFVERAPDGQLSRIDGVTHWCWLLDSQLDDSDDD